MKAIVMTLLAAGAALAAVPASAQWGGPGPYRPRYADPFGRPAAGGCPSGHCPAGGCSTGACAGRCGCDPRLCETGWCGADCDMTACGSGDCVDGKCCSAGARAGVRPFAPTRPVVDPAPALRLGRGFDRPITGGYGRNPLLGDRAARRNW